MSESDHNTLGYQLDLKCKPLDTLEDIHEFMVNPPAWRTLCEPLRPHSKYLIKNSEVNPNFEGITLERPQSFCHFDPDVDDPPRYLEDQLPRTLVCHDMANGYHDDSAIDGTGDHNAYVFYHWAGVDIFCYFSHHLITIPPLGWINVAHTHGVKVIGTIITEWTEGSLFWHHVLASELQMQTLVSALVTIAKTLKFEGWLLNVENKVSAPERLVTFVDMLHRTLHAELPGAVLIWYDSVISDGSLSWQNALNHKNKQFFDVCDGFFTNYSWCEADVAASAEAAGARRRDLYIGIDVWGRNFYGGGQFNTQEAVKVAHAHGCSLAIFAPAWTFEALGADNDPCDPHAVLAGAGLPRLRRLMLRDRALWDSLWPYLNTRLPTQLPFQTSFCTGQGKKRRMYGEVLCNTAWYNLRHMQYQASCGHGAHCYLLASGARLRSASRLALRDVRGILKLRASLDLAAADTSADTLDDTPADHKDAGAHTGVAGAHTGVAGEQSAEQLAEPAPRALDSATAVHADVDSSDDSLNKPKFKNVFKNILKLKKTKVEFKGPSTIDEERSPSMEQVAPDLRLQLCDQRTRLTLAYVREERDCLELHFDDSYNGGCCLKIHPTDYVSEQHRTVRLFQCDFPCEEALIACVVTKTVARAPHQSLNVWLHAVDAAAQRRRVALVCRRLAHASPPASPGLLTRYPERPGCDDFKALQDHLVLNQPGFYMPIQNHFGWQVFYFVVSLPGARVTSIAAHTSDLNGAMLLGHVGVCAWPRPPAAAAAPAAAPPPACAGTQAPEPVVSASQSAPALVSSHNSIDEGPKNEWKEK